MTTISFYARGDSNTANNASLNAKGISTTPVTQLTFTSGTGGDIKLDYNGGQNDPDTQVILNGVTQGFRVEFTGNLPTTNKLANVNGVDLRGKEITVITTADGQRFFFLNDGSGTLGVMTAFPNGAHGITGSNYAPGTVLLCFLGGTRIATPQGPRAVESLRPGDGVTTADGRTLPVRWIGDTVVGEAALQKEPALHPVIIPKNFFGPGLPLRALGLSPGHRISCSGWQTEMLFGCSEVLLPAAHLRASVKPLRPVGPITYYHILLDEHAMLIAEGLPAESFQPGARGATAMGAAETRALCDLMGTTLPELLSRPDAAQTLRQHETQVLLALLRHPQRAAAA
ncbi:Hint domain-containing protein [Gemmobacter aquatilis]|uniref:Hint domain-containing protein n=1 Tax=Gemmobacter aquatilis TaxID=933059 RepID=A0A1H8FCB8_9RHOB|nr:Hint domain-containing protein [Gemmobacter aquatilis]SEN28678.1 Hint domain-containing protein [Gemmobacter aquatilis]